MEVEIQNEQHRTTWKWNGNILKMEMHVETGLGDGTGERLEQDRKGIGKGLVRDYRSRKGIGKGLERDW